MSGSLNRAQLIGNVGADPDIKALANGDRVANLSLATSESWTDKRTGEKRERTEWHRVTVWTPGLVGVVERYVKKGSKLFLEGAIRTRKWQDQSGVDRYSTEIVLAGFDSRLVLLGDPARGSGGSRDHAIRPDQPGARRDLELQPTPPGSGSAPAEIDDEIPF